MAFGFPAYHTENYTLNDGTSNLRASVKSALKAVSWSIRKESPDTIVASTSLSLLSWGERVIITFLSDESITVTSKCTWPIQCFDWGKNKANIKKIIAELKCPDDQAPEADQIRKDHINTETNIKFTGVIYGIFGLLIGINEISSDGSDLSQSFRQILVLIGIPLGSLTLGIGLFKLKKSARVFAGILSLIWGVLIVEKIPFDRVFKVLTQGSNGYPVFVNYLGVIILSITLMISVFFPFLLFGRKGRFVTTSHYREIIGKTPHVMSWFKKNKFLGGLLVITVILVAIIITVGMKAG